MYVLTSYPPKLSSRKFFFTASICTQKSGAKAIRQYRAFTNRLLCAKDPCQTHFQNPSAIQPFLKVDNVGHYYIHLYPLLILHYIALLNGQTALTCCHFKPYTFKGTYVLLWLYYIIILIAFKIHKYSKHCLY